jgi:hypothetical protein
MLDYHTIMGRKPDPIVAKYFTRGAKIDDASNRYQFTCKQCGERFPKGRIGSLYTHIKRKCTALSLQARNGTALSIHKLGLADDAASATKNKAKVHKVKKAGLPLTSYRQQNSNGLDVLAEASCRLVATQHSYSPSRIPPAINGADVGVGSTVLDPALENKMLTSSVIHGMETDRLSWGDGDLFLCLIFGEFVSDLAQESLYAGHPATILFLQLRPSLKILLATLGWPSRPILMMMIFFLV